MIGLVGLAAELKSRAESHGPITIGLAGAGQMGTDIVVQAGLLPGVRIGAISEIRPQTAIDAVLMSGRERRDVVQANSGAAIDRAIEAGCIAITSDYEALCSSGRVDVVIDATGNPNVGTLVALAAFKNGKHVVLLNVEADITIGRFLKQEAERAGVGLTGAVGRIGERAATAPWKRR